jgi:ABC-2 type transport system permease protein
MSVRSLSAAELEARHAPPMGALNGQVLQIEVRRLLRNRRTFFFALLAPSIFFLLFGLNSAYANLKAGPGSSSNTSAFILVSMALYGAVLATTSGGAMVSIERAAGWSRQLRLTPLSPAAYITIKVLTAMVLGAGSVLVVFVVAAATGKPSMPLGIWIVSAVCVWIGSIVFAAFGLLVGYLLPTENVMQLMGIVLVLLSFAGGLFIPLSQFPHTIGVIAEFTPLYGLNQLVHAPMLGNSVHIAWVANAVVWLIIFAGGAMLRFRKDTARV